MDSNQNCLSIDELIDSQLNILTTIFESNDFESVITQTDPYINTSVFHSGLKTKICLLKAGLTLDESDLKTANESVCQTIDLCKRLKRRKLFPNLSAKFGKTSCDKYTDEELHAELTYAMVIGCCAALELIQCHNLKNLAKIVYKISVCMKSFRLCRTIYEKRTKWLSNKSRTYFQCGISLERGFRHLIVSYIPPKVLKIINFLGYRGVRDIAFQELNRTAFECNTIYSIISELVLIIYWLYVETHTSFGPKHTPFFQQLVNTKLSQFPNSVLYRSTNAKLMQLKGDLNHAISEYETIIAHNKQMFHKLLHFELMFCYAVRCEWYDAVRYAELLSKHTVHSPAITTYLEAIFRYTKATDTNDRDLKREVTCLMGTVPSLRIRYVGKTMTFEKAVVVFSQRYFQNNDYMLLPVLVIQYSFRYVFNNLSTRLQLQEILYHLNYIFLLKDNKLLLKEWMFRVDKEIECHSKMFVITRNGDYYLTALFYKGIIYKLMGSRIEAQQYFKAIINQANCIVKAKDGLIPQTLLELALIEMQINNKEKAKELLERILKIYCGYTTENLLHIKVYSALRDLGCNTDKVSDHLDDEYNDHNELNN